MSTTPITDAAANPSYCECNPGTVVNIAVARELEMELAAISTALDKEFDPSKGDKRSGDLLDDLACFIEHHKTKERELATALARENTNFRLYCDRDGQMREWREIARTLYERLAMHDGCSRFGVRDMKPMEDFRKLNTARQ